MNTTIINAIRETASKFGTFRYAYVGLMTHVSDGHGGSLELAVPHWEVRYGWYRGMPSGMNFHNRAAAFEFAKRWIIGSDNYRGN